LGDAAGRGRAEPDRGAGAGRPGGAVPGGVQRARRATRAQCATARQLVGRAGAASAACANATTAAEHSEPDEPASRRRRRLRGSHSSAGVIVTSGFKIEPAALTAHASGSKEAAGHFGSLAQLLQQARVSDDCFGPLGELMAYKYFDSLQECQDLA